MDVIPVTQRIDGSGVALAMLIVIAVKVALADDRSTLQFKLFQALLGMTIAELVLDITSLVIEGKPGVGVWLNLVFIVYFIIQPSITYVWSLYADYQTYFDVKRLRKLALILSPPILLHTFLVLASPVTGWVFSIDSSNIYSRGSLFLVCSAIPFLYLALTLGMALVQWPRISPRSRFALLFFAVPPSVGGVVQGFFYGVTLLWPGVALSILMVYLSIESEILITDHLTGLHNRRSFDRYLSRKLKSFPADKLFTLLMIDLDGFKRINDCFGHAQGDEALSETANVLRRCLHANDFIARYAGDEFVVIADIHRPEDATTLCSRIEESFESYNRESGKQWRLCASMGTAICDPGSLQCPGKLIEEADKKMYQDKACGRHATVPPSVLTISS